MPRTENSPERSSHAHRHHKGQYLPGEHKPWQFKPGHSGNPGGRPRIAWEVRALAQQHAPDAIRVLVALMKGSEDERVRVAAASTVLDRALGRPEQAVAVTIPDSVAGHLITDALEAATVYAQVMFGTVDLNTVRMGLPGPAVTAPGGDQP
jgi:hypothetical protein